MKVFHNVPRVLGATVCLGLMAGCTTGIVSNPLSSSVAKVSDGLTYHLRSSAIKLSATYRLTDCKTPTAQLEGLTLSELTTKDGREGAVFTIDTKELAAGSKVFDTTISLQDGFIKSVNYKATDKTGEIIKDIATLAVKLPIAASIMALTPGEFTDAGFACHPETALKVQRYQQHQTLITKAYGVLDTLQLKLAKPVPDAVSDDVYIDGLRKLKEQIIKVLITQGGVANNKDLADAYKKYVDLLDGVITNSQKAQLAKPTDAQKTELANAIKAVQELIATAQTAIDKLGADLLATFSSTVTPDNTGSLEFPKFDYTPALKWGEITDAGKLFKAGITLDVTDCKGNSGKSPLCNSTTGVDCASKGKPYAVYYRTPALCKVTVRAAGTKLAEIDNKEFLQFGRLNRLTFKNGPFEDTEQSVTFDASGNVTEYKQSAKSSATDTALTSIAESADTLSQRKLEKLKAQKVIADAEKDLYESQKKRDDALQALSNTAGANGD